MIRATRLTRLFGKRAAVEDVTFEVCPGEIFGLLGPNGAGKTTILRMLAGLISPTSGEASVAGIPLTKTTIDRVRGQVGLLTEAPGLWDRLSVRVNLLTYARLYQLPCPEAVVSKALERFGLADRTNDLAAELSKGLKQRVALARALLHDPPVVLLDEPTSGLDPENAKQVRDLIRTLRKQQRTVIISTHNLDEAERLSDRVGVLRGRFLAVARPEELRHRMFGTRVRIQLDGDAGSLVPEATAAGARDVTAAGGELAFAASNPEAVTPAVVRALVLAGGRVLRVAGDETPLEEIDLALVRAGDGAERRP